MKTLHITPGDSAAGSLRQALRLSGRAEEVLAFRDDLSWGPIASEDLGARTAWWQEQIDWPEIEANLRSFWERVDIAAERIVVWFGRHSARELAFRLAWASRMRERSYYLIDVTGLPVPPGQRTSEAKTTSPVPAVSIVPAVELKMLLGSETPVSAEEDVRHCRDWANLKEENAPFRIVTPSGLTSAPIDYFDQLLLDQATSQWRKMARIVGGALASSSAPYHQVGDLALHKRAVALIENGKLTSVGDPWDMHHCEVRLP